jgi:sodium-dependent dicarboxylate transporter 2/3/5
VSGFAGLLLADLGLPPDAHRLAAIAWLVIVFWITEPIPLAATGLLGTLLAVILGVAPTREVLAPYADPVIFLFLGAFLVGEAITSSGLDSRVARSLLVLGPLRRSPAALVVALVGLTAGLSMWISNTAAAAIMMPLALSMYRGRDEAGRDASAPIVLAVAYAASIGGIGTPVGTPPNLIALGFLERQGTFRPDFGTWMALGVPLAVVMLSVLVVRSLPRIRRAGAASADNSPDMPVNADLDLPPAAPWTPAHRVIGCVFAAMVLAWLLPSLLRPWSPAASEALSDRLPESMVAVGGALLLFMLPARVRPWQPVLQWYQVARVDWGTILLFGSGMSLGTLVLKTGLGASLGEAVLGTTGVTTLPGLVALAAGTALVMTEFMSNTAAANVLMPVVFAMAVGLDLPPVLPVVAAALGASMAFAMPVATPPNAIAYGTGKVTMGQMLRRGLVMNAIALAAIVGWLSLVAALGWVGA